MLIKLFIFLIPPFPLICGSSSNEIAQPRKGVERLVILIHATNYLLHSTVILVCLYDVVMPVE